MSQVLDFCGISIKVDDKLSCKTPIEGYLTCNKVYVVIDLREEEERVIIVDDRGLEMWARGDRFCSLLSNSNLIQHSKTEVFMSYSAFKQYEKLFASDGGPLCKDCGIKTEPGIGSARCPQCWNSRHEE